MRDLDHAQRSGREKLPLALAKCVLAGVEQGDNACDARNLRPWRAQPATLKGVGTRTGLGPRSVTRSPKAEDMGSDTADWGELAHRPGFLGGKPGLRERVCRPGPRCGQSRAPTQGRATPGTREPRPGAARQADATGEAWPWGRGPVVLGSMESMPQGEGTQPVRSE